MATLTTDSQMVSYSVSNNGQTNQTRASVMKNDTLTENEAYQESEQPVYSCIEPLSDPIIPTSQNPAYGEVPTRAEDYCIPGEMDGETGVVTTRNEAYATSQLPGSNQDPSIPTTENQAYTSVSDNTERVKDEETYDYVREL